MKTCRKYTIFQVFMAFPLFSSHTDYSSRLYKTICTRTTAIAQLDLLPLALVRVIRQYEEMVAEHSIPIDTLHRGDIYYKGRATAFALLPNDRLVFAHSSGLLGIANYKTGEQLHVWESHQKYIDQIETITCSTDPHDDRIYTRTASLTGTNSLKLWNGLGEKIFSKVNNYTINYDRPMPLLFDAATIATSQMQDNVNHFMLLRGASPFTIERKDCKHALYLTPTRIILGYRSGLIEYWHYKDRSLWERVPLKVNEDNLQPITALCTSSEHAFMAGFLDGTIEAWKYVKTTGMWEAYKTWKAHKESVKNIKIFNNNTCITSAKNILKLWQLPNYEDIGETEYPTEIVSVLTTNNPYPPNYAIVCLEEELQVYSC